MTETEPDTVIHGEPWWRSKVEPERHQWSVRCVQHGGVWAVNVLDVPSVVRDPLVLAAALTAANGWINA